MYRAEELTYANPEHYRSHPSGIECIDLIRHLPTSQGMAIKYLWRAGQKDDIVKDLNKALWYIEDCGRYGCYKNARQLPYDDAMTKWYAAEKTGYRDISISAMLQADIYIAKRLVERWLATIKDKDL